MSGVCWDHNEDLVKYITERKDTYINANMSIKGYNGVAWNSSGCWAVKGQSNQTVYALSQLKPFLPKPHEVALRPLTPEECFPPDKFCLRITHSNSELVKTFLAYKKHEYDGWLKSWNPKEAVGLYLCYPQQTKHCYAEPTYRRNYLEISEDFFVKYMLTISELPEKWCIVNKEDNHEMLTKFLREHKNEWPGYKDSWYVSPLHNYFHYPPADPFGHSEDTPKKGYVLITTNQFLKHVLTQSPIFTNNLKTAEDEKVSSGGLKIQRPNLTVRDTDPVRATGIRCAKSKIQIRSGHCSD